MPTLRGELTQFPLTADTVGMWLETQGCIEEVLQQIVKEQIAMSQAAAADEVTIPIPPGSLAGEGPEFIKPDQATAVAPTPPAPPQQPKPAAQPQRRNVDLGARQLQHALGAQVNYALYLQRILPEDIAARVGIDADRFEQFLAGRDGSITLDELLSVVRETGARLAFNFMPPQVQRAQ